VTELDAAKIPDKPVSFSCPGCQGKVPVDGAKLKAEAQQEAAASAPAAGPTGAAPEDALQHLELPDDARFPSGLVVGTDMALFHELEKVLAARGSTLRTCAGADEAKALMSLAMPELLFFCASGEVGQPPFEDIQPLLEMPNDDRRRCFIVLVGDKVKSMDGNAAFFHGVDLMLARKDAALADRILFTALQFRDKLAAPFVEALASVEG
jgi:hypothetical protein